MSILQVCVVTIESRRFFDECEKSYLPLMNTIFGIYLTKEKAEKEVWDYFMRRFEGKYEICLQEEDIEGMYLDYDVVFKRTDKEYGGVAYYGVNYHIETIEE